MFLPCDEVTSHFKEGKENEATIDCKKVTGSATRINDLNHLTAG